MRLRVIMWRGKKYYLLKGHRNRSVLKIDAFWEKRPLSAMCLPNFSYLGGRESGGKGITLRYAVAMATKKTASRASK